eukprot:670786_1
MSRTKAIEFLHLISQLTHDERVGFVSSLAIAQTRMDLVFTSLFTHIAKTNQINEANHLNESLSDIINSRKDKPKAILTNNIRLHQLPRALIGYTASFLPQMDYVKFAMSNRSIYLGCNSPNLLHDLDLSGKDYSSINLEAFPSIKSLHIEPSTVIELPYTFASPNFKHVNTLTLDAHYACGWVQQFLNLNIVNCESVTTLDCLDFGSADPEVDMETNDFLILLTRFPNLKYIKLSGVFVADDITAQGIANLCSNVVGLHLDGGVGQIEDLIPLFAKKLKHLSFARTDDPLIDFNTLSFDALEELQLFSPNNQTFDGIVNSALNVNKILMTQIPNEPHWPSDSTMSNTNIRNGMIKLIDKCQRLKYMCLAIQSTAFCSAMEGIEAGLLKTKRQHRMELKMVIHAWGLNIKPNAFQLNVGRIVNSLESMSINDFMFSMEFHDADDNELAKMFEDLHNIVSIDTKIFLYPTDVS